MPTQINETSRISDFVAAIERKMDDFSFTIEVITRGFVLKSCFLSFNKSICGAFELCEKHSRDTGNPSQGLQIKSISVSISHSLRPSPSPHRFVLPYLDSSLQQSAISAGAADKTTELRMAMAMSVNWKGGSTVTSFAPPRNRGCHVNSNETSRRITSSLMVSFGYNANCSAASIDKACNFGPRQQLYPWSEPNLIPRYRRRPTNNVFLPHLVASMEVEVTYIMVKPDGVQRGLVGEIISRFEKKGFLMKGLKLFQCSKELAEEHYKELKSKPFFPKLIDYITSGPVVCMAWEGVGVVASARKLIGATNPLQAEPGTIRGDLAIQTGRNIVHGSDSPENGLREIALWFKEGELCGWTQVQASWLME